MLKDMGDYRRAMAVLLYADSVQPNAPLILVNRAWVRYELGDLDGAKPLFDEVARRAPVLTSAQVGLGLIAYCTLTGGREEQPEVHRVSQKVCRV